VTRCCQNNFASDERGARLAFCMTKRSPFRYFKTSPEIIRLAGMLFVGFPLSPSGAEELQRQHGA
jgi:hypothetical protein